MNLPRDQHKKGGLYLFRVVSLVDMRTIAQVSHSCHHPQQADRTADPESMNLKSMNLVTQMVMRIQFKWRFILMRKEAERRQAAQSKLALTSTRTSTARRPNSVLVGIAQKGREKGEKSRYETGEGKVAEVAENAGTHSQHNDEEERDEHIEVGRLRQDEGDSKVASSFPATVEAGVTVTNNTSPTVAATAAVAAFARFVERTPMKFRAQNPVPAGIAKLEPFPEGTEVSLSKEGGPSNMPEAALIRFVKRIPPVSLRKEGGSSNTRACHALDLWSSTHGGNLNRADLTEPCLEHLEMLQQLRHGVPRLRRVQTVERLIRQRTAEAALTRFVERNTPTKSKTTSASRPAENAPGEVEDRVWRSGDARGSDIVMAMRRMWG